MRVGPLRFARHGPPAVVALNFRVIVNAVSHIVNLPTCAGIDISWHYMNLTIALGNGAD